MAIKIKTDLEWGQVFYVKTCLEQNPYQLTGLVVLPGNQIKFILSHLGDEIQVHDFECSPEPNDLMIRHDPSDSD